MQSNLAEVFSPENLEATRKLFQPRDGDILESSEEDKRGWRRRDILRNGRWYFYDFTEKPPTILVATDPELFRKALELVY